MMKPARAVHHVFTGCIHLQDDGFQFVPGKSGGDVAGGGCGEQNRIRGDADTAEVQTVGPGQRTCRILIIQPEEPTLHGSDRCLGAVLDTELGEDALQMVFYRGEGNLQFGDDLLVAAAGDDKFENGKLAEFNREMTVMSAVS
jgi:hypothetical protein